MYYKELSNKIRQLANAIDEGLPQQVAHRVMTDLATELDLSIRECERDSRWNLIENLNTQRLDRLTREAQHDQKLS